MEETVPFFGREYFVYLLILAFARGMDFLSTWIATPRLVLEGNPIAKWLGWKGGALINIAMCLGFAAVPMAAIIIGTTSVLVAARNFQGAWLMRTMGEHNYRAWMSDRMCEGRTGLYVFCVIAQAGLTAGIGAALVWIDGPGPVPFGIGIGMMGYAAAVFIYSLLGVWRSRPRRNGNSEI
ncbi:MAG: hypothetical protein RLY20_1149 [Verrucomicrobiota bacterium]